MFEATAAMALALALMARRIDVQFSKIPSILIKWNFYFHTHLNRDIIHTV